MVKSMASPSDLWHIRKQMTLQLASFIFLTYVMSMGARVPSRIHISRSTGKIYTSDMLPCSFFIFIPADLILTSGRSYSHRAEQGRVLQQRSCSLPIHSQLPTLHHSDRNGRTAHELDDGDRTMSYRVRGESPYALRRAELTFVNAVRSRTSIEHLHPRRSRDLESDVEERATHAAPGARPRQRGRSRSTSKGRRMQHVAFAAAQRLHPRQPSDPRAPPPSHVRAEPLEDGSRLGRSALVFIFTFLLSFCHSFRIILFRLAIVSLSRSLSSTFCEILCSLMHFRNSLVLRQNFR